MLKSSLPHLMKTKTMAMKSATKAQAVTHCGIPDMLYIAPTLSLSYLGAEMTITEIQIAMINNSRPWEGGGVTSAR